MANSFYLMEDLLNITQLQFGVIKGTRIERELKRSKDTLFKTIWERITLQQEEHRSEHRTRHSKRRNSGNIVRTLAQGVTKVREGNFALVVESTEAAYISSKRPCDLTAYDQFLSVANFGFALKKGSSLVADLDTALLHLQDDSLLQTIFHKWFYNEGECEGMFTEELPHEHFEDLPHIVIDKTELKVIPTVSPELKSPTTTILPLTTTKRRERRRKTTTTISPPTVTMESTTLPTTKPLDYSHDTKEFLQGPVVHESVMTVSPSTTTSRRSHSKTLQTNTQHPPVDNLEDDNKDNREDHSMEWFFQTELPREEEDNEYDSIENRDVNDVKAQDAVFIEYSTLNNTDMFESTQSSSLSCHCNTRTVKYVCLLLILLNI